VTPPLGVSQGGAVALAYAAKHPGRVRRVVLYGAFDRGWLVDQHDDTIITQYRIFTDAARLGWGRDDPWFRQLFTSRFMPGGDRDLWEAFNELQKTTTTPEIAAQILELCGRIDVTAAAARVRAPTLILHGRQDKVIEYPLGRAVAANVPDARFVALDTDNHLLLADEPAWAVFRREVLSFLNDQHHR
jgi:pimeloyl-ACP methyl ester carboxylesterase